MSLLLLLLDARNKCCPADPREDLFRVSVFSKWSWGTCFLEAAPCLELFSVICSSTEETKQKVGCCVCFLTLERAGDNQDESLDRKGRRSI